MDPLPSPRLGISCAERSLGHQLFIAYCHSILPKTLRTPIAVAQLLTNVEEVIDVKHIRMRWLDDDCNALSRCPIGGRMSSFFLRLSLPECD
jgi:hypothetical protein